MDTELSAEERARVIELGQLAKRITQRDEAEARDRARQRVLIRERIADGATWDTVMAEAKVSRPTILKALKRED